MAIEAGKEYKIISSTNGPKGKCVGRKCRTVFAHEGPPHTVWGQIWNVTTVDGKPFETDVGIMGDNCDVAEDWLQEPDPIPPKAITKDLERAYD